MNHAARTLLEQHFETAFTASDGISKMRELILSLAMQGKLVEQDPADQPASELLKEIEAEKQRLVRAGKIKAPKLLPPIRLEEVPYQLPQGWKWVRLGEIGIINPRNDADDVTKAGFVPMSMIPEGYSEKHQFEERSWSKIKKGYTHFADGDIGMAKITPCFENGKSCVFSGLPNGIGAGTTELHIFRNSFNSVEPRFLLWHLKNPYNISKSVPKMTGSAGQKRVPTPYFTEQLFPLPPLSEQHRIVARIDQLMARCDALETLRKEREEKRLAVHAAAIQQLLSTQSSTAWDFIEQNFNELYSVKENVSELRKAILQLAVMGRLVLQDPSDSPASELLKEIETEKKQLVKAGKIKAPKPLPPVAENEKPYELPQGWEWVRLGDVGQTQTGTTPKSGDDSSYGKDVPFIKPADLTRDNVDYFNEGLSYAGANKYGRVAPAGSSLMVCIGTIGKTNIINCDCSFNQQINAITPYKPLSPFYIQYFIRSSFFQTECWKRSSSTTIAILNKGKWESIPLALPPLAEQYRIVAKIDELMVLCDSLDQQMDAATAKQAELLDAVMAQV